MTVPQSNRFDEIIAPPTPWERYRAGLFRLAGFGGALVMLRSGVVGDPPALTLDVGFLSPRDYVWAMRQPMSANLSHDLSGFFFACASDLFPEVTVDAVSDGPDGLAVRALSSSDDQVELEFVIGDEGLNMLTTRVALTLAADQVAALMAPNTSRYFDEQDEGW